MPQPSYGRGAASTYRYMSAGVPARGIRRPSSDLGGRATDINRQRMLPGNRYIGTLTLKWRSLYRDLANSLVVANIYHVQECICTCIFM